MFTTFNKGSFKIKMTKHFNFLQFENFYGNQYKGRNLTWLHHLSQAEVRMHTTSRPYFVSSKHNKYVTVF